MANTLVTLFAALALSLLTAGFFTLIGRAVLRMTGVDEQPLTLWLVAPAVGAVCWSAPMFFLLSVFGFHPIIVSVGAVLAIAAALFVLRTPYPAIVRAQAILILAVVALVAIIPVLGLLPAFRDGGVYFSTIVFDHIKAALADSIVRHGLPPVSPFVAPNGEPAGLFYYYGWYVLAAELRAIFGCSGYIADIALSHLTAFVSLALIAGIAYRLAGSRAAIIGALLIAPAADLQGIVTTLIGGDAMIKLRGWEWGLDGWLEQNFWAPQHVFAGIGVVVAILALCWLTAKEAKAWRLVVILAAAAAAAVTSSIYAGAFVLAAIAVPVALLLFWRDQPLWRIVPPLAIAVVVAVILAAPMIRTLLQLGGGPEKVVELWIYPSLGFLDTSSPIGKLANIIGFWILLLPLRLGPVYLLGLWGLRVRPGGRDERFLFWALSLVTILVTLVIAAFLKSAISRNDLGWRIIIPGVFLLTAYAGAVLGLWMRRCFGRSEQSTARARPCVAFGVVLAISIAVTVQGWRTATAHFFGPNQQDTADAETHRILAAQPAAWRDVRAKTKPTDLVVSNPTAFDKVTEWEGNLPFALFADRSSLLSSVNWANLLSSQLIGTPIVADYAKLLERLFAGRASADDLSRLAGPLKVKMVVVTPLDGLWANDASILSGFEKVKDAPRYRLYAPRSGEPKR